MACNLKEALAKCIDEVLEVRENIGADLHRVSLVERKWSGEHIGDGRYKDSITQIRPTPGIKEFAHDIRLLEGGAIQQGDILITSISKNRFNRDFLSVQDTDAAMEKFYLIDDREYRIVNITEHLVTWNILVRQTVNRRTSERYYGDNTRRY